uniref:Kazal-like domain-containing protein n=1 Tax=Chelydra serpentina TaxID=8475 RepID=A0A8C3RTA2_CHESE
LPPPRRQGREPIDCTGYVKTRTGQEAACTLEYSPICGTDGATYGNKCAFCSANGRHPVSCVMLRPYLQVNCSDYNEYQSPPTFCYFDYNPVCGTDNNTYGNKCAFCGAVL